MYRCAMCGEELKDEDQAAFWMKVPNQHINARLYVCRHCWAVASGEE